jgi:hypothetical protein
MEIILDILKYVIIPAITFAAGLFSKWFLQSQKARDDTLRALAPERARALAALWRLTTPFALGSSAQLDKDQRRTADINFRKWYYDDAGQLLLSWRTTKHYLLAIDALRDTSASDEALRHMFSRLRTQLKRDCGIYSWWNSWRKLPTPRAPLAG